MDRLIAVSSRNLKPSIVLAINTGMRRGEIFNLKWSHVDLKNRIIEVADSKNGDQRFTHINDTLLNTLQLLAHRIDTPYVFPGKEGERLTDLKKAFSSARKRAGLDDVRFQDLLRRMNLEP